MHKKMGQQLERTGKIHQKEVQIKSKSGKIITGLYSGEIIESLGKHFLLSVITDITLQKDAEQAFRLGMAAGTAAVLTPGTDLCQREEVDRMAAMLGVTGRFDRERSG